MNLFEIFRKVDLKELRNNGGMEKVYGILISEIVSLSAYTNKYNLLTNYQTSVSLVKENKLVISIRFNSASRLFEHTDTFELSEYNNKLGIIFKRETNYRLPLLPQLLPKNFSASFSYDKAANQRRVLVLVLNSLISTFSQKYNFHESLFEDKKKELMLIV